MNCRDFETIIVEIARDRLMDAAARERGLEHVLECARCATLLVEERALSRDLRALSVRHHAEEAPERIETALLAAFRQAPGQTRRSAPTIVAPGQTRRSAPTIITAGRTRRSAITNVALRRRRRLLAVAALVALTFGISLAAWIASPPKREAPGIGSTDGKAVPARVPAAPEKSDQTPQRLVEIRRSDRRIRGATSEKRQKRLAKAPADRRSPSNEAPREFVTQFFPIMQGVELMPLEGGQVVRVVMPRSNLIPLGIPFNQERANETIKADVLVSNGLARAIRLVY